MVSNMPQVFSRLVKKAAMIRMMIVTGIAATVRANSRLPLLITMTTNCTVKPRKKKKSNFKRAI